MAAIGAPVSALTTRPISMACWLAGVTIILISIDAGETDNEPPLDPPSRNPGPDVLLQIAESFRLMRESLDRLGEPCREIIELRYFGELSYDEIAAELRLNAKTVSSRLSKCLDRLLNIAKDIFNVVARGKGVFGDVGGG